ncbi:MAG: ferritin-like protein [Deltaproteobacteria bacterium]|nr:ferritin-like protein [Deltaproteobacteria bacterium]
MKVTAPPVITTKDQLIYYLGEACVLEHQFMCQYLYAAFSLKKAPDGSCTAAQFEFVRRWASTLYMIARQEMEHLSIANSILTAVGGVPVFYHLELPTQSAWYQSAARASRNADSVPAPCDMPFVFAPFDLTTVRRFCCMESPGFEEVPLPDRARVLSWCFQNDVGQCPCVTAGLSAALTVTPRFTSLEAPPDTVEPGTVAELYAAIDQGLAYLNATLGHEALFSGHASGQSEIPSEYQLFLFPICDLTSAQSAIRMVIQQGEGLDSPPGSDAHFQLFYDMAVAYEQLLAEDPGFTPANPIPLDADPYAYSSPVTQAAVRLWQRGYATLLFMLTGYYDRYRPKEWNTYPALTAALQMSAIAPLMTMFSRSLGEVVAALPGAPFAAYAGVDLNITQEQLHLLVDPTQPPYGDVNFYRGRMYELIDDLAALAAMPGMPANLADKVTYIAQNMFRVAGNIGQIYTNGIFPPFNPNIDQPSCPADTGGCE